MRVVARFQKRGEISNKHVVMNFVDEKFKDCRKWCHHAYPTEEDKNADNWDKPSWETSSRKSHCFLYGPACCRKTRIVMYPCYQGGCFLGCPCYLCQGMPLSNVSMKEQYDNHEQYHHARHANCEFCSQIFLALPGYAYDSFLVEYGEYDGHGHFAKRIIPHKSYTFYHSYDVFTVSKQLQFQCDECKKTFSTITNKDRHMKTSHIQTKSFQCKECKKCFDRPDVLKKHREVHDSDPYLSTCDHCETTFNNIDNWEKHKKANFDEKGQAENVCEECDADFCNQKLLKQHIKKMHFETKTKYKCPTCNSLFGKLSQLLLHKRNSHESDLEKYQCENCDMVFTNASNRKRHVKTVHILAKSKICGDCDKVFDRSDVLENHIIEVHGPERHAFTCKHCNIKFTKYDNWLRHRTGNFNENGEPKSTCSECDEDFCNPRLLKQHIKKYHIKCEDCNEQFTRKTSLIVHRLRAKVPCPVCSDAFCNKKQLALHKKVSHELKAKSFQCEKCEVEFGKRWLLQRHMKKHM